MKKVFCYLFAILFLTSFIACSSENSSFVSENSENSDSFNRDSVLGVWCKKDAFEREYWRITFNSDGTYVSAKTPGRRSRQNRDLEAPYVFAALNETGTFSLEGDIIHFYDSLLFTYLNRSDYINTRNIGKSSAVVSFRWYFKTDDNGVQRLVLERIQGEEVSGIVESFHPVNE